MVETTNIQKNQFELCVIGSMSEILTLSLRNWSKATTETNSLSTAGESERAC